MSIRFSRSLSLPPRLQPILSQINHQIQTLRFWQLNPNSPSRIAAGLSLIDRLHSSFANLINHTQTRNPLRLRGLGWADRLLEDSLRFADAYGGFRSAIIELNHHLKAARAAVRRRDEAGLASASREQRRTEKRLLRLASEARSIGRPAAGIATAADGELAGVANEVTSATAAASAAVFAGIAMLASAAVAGLSAAGLSQKCVVGSMLWRSAAFKKRVEDEGERWREKAMEKMEAVEKSIAELEVLSHRVFRRMLNTRVFLLNAQSPFAENGFSFRTFD